MMQIKQMMDRVQPKNLKMMANQKKKGKKQQQITNQKAKPNLLAQYQCSPSLLLHPRHNSQQCNIDGIPSIVRTMMHGPMDLNPSLT